MIEYSIIKINFEKRPLHLSDGRGLYYTSEGILHSDTFKNAVFTSVLKFHNLDSTAAKSFYDSFFFSSGHPFYEEEFFFKKPTGYLFTDLASLKAIKKVEYIGKSLFENWANGNDISFLRAHNFADGAFISEHPDVKSFAENEKIITRQVQERVRIRRLSSGDSEPYFMEQLRFKKNGGLYFFVEFSNNITTKQKELFQQGLNLLADEGVGSDKTYGFGQFEVLQKAGEYLQKMQLNLPQNTNTHYSTGLFTPSENEIADLSWLQKSKYRIVERGGYLANPANPNNRRYRRSVGKFLQIGSVICDLSDPSGQCLDLAPSILKNSHPVWREGRTILLPVKIAK